MSNPGSSGDLPPYLKSLPLSIGSERVSLAVNFSEEKGEKVDVWPMVFDIQYKQILSDEDASSSVKFWRRSADNAEIPAVEMDEWIRSTVDCLSPHLNSRTRVLEIGCGNGLIFSSIIERVGEYVGLDPAGSAIEAIENSELYEAHSEKIALYKLDGLSVDSIVQREFDLVIINSVAQYFEGLSYLFELVNKLKLVTKEESILFFGDLRSLELQNKFAMEVASIRAESSNSNFEDILADVLGRERETLYSPLLFELMPQWFEWIDGAFTEVRRSVYRNEMSLYRYNAFLVRGRGETAEFEVECCSEEITSQDLRSEQREDVVWVGLDNPRFSPVASGSEKRCEGGEKISELFDAGQERRRVVSFDPFSPEGVIVFSDSLKLDSRRMLKHPKFEDWLVGLDCEGSPDLEEGGDKVIALNSLLCNRS